MTEAFGLDSFTPDRDAVTQVPATVTLRWAVRGAACVVLSDHGPVQGMAQDVEVHATTTFVLTAYAADLAAVDAKSVTITAPEPAASPEIPKGVIATWHGDPRRIPTGLDALRRPRRHARPARPLRARRRRRIPPRQAGRR